MPLYFPAYDLRIEPTDFQPTLPPHFILVGTRSAHAILHLCFCRMTAKC